MVPAKTLIRDSASQELLVRQKNSASMSEMNQPLLQVLLSLSCFSQQPLSFFPICNIGNNNRNQQDPHITNQRWVHKWQWEAAEFRHWQTQSGGVWWSSIHKQIYPNIPNLERKCMNVRTQIERSIFSAMPSQSSVSLHWLHLLQCNPAAAASLAHNSFDPPTQIAVRNQAGQMICIWIPIKLSFRFIQNTCKKKGLCCLIFPPKSFKIL
jgi:hypothetical protein